MRQLKVLELFSGTRSVSKAFERHGHETFCVDWDERFEADLHDDIEFLKASKILRLFGRPDVIHLSPDCATFSMAAISKHRSKNPSGGVSLPPRNTPRSATASTSTACASSGTSPLSPSG